jgi:hypothetical protein
MYETLYGRDTAPSVKFTLKDFSIKKNWLRKRLISIYFTCGDDIDFNEKKSEKSEKKDIECNKNHSLSCFLSDYYPSVKITETFQFLNSFSTRIRNCFILVALSAFDFSIISK